MKTIRYLLLILLAALTAPAAQLITTTTFTRQVLTNVDAAGVRAKIGVNVTNVFVTYVTNTYYQTNITYQTNLSGGGTGSSNILDQGYSLIITNTDVHSNVNMTVSGHLGTPTANIVSLNGGTLVLTNGVSGTNITWGYNVFNNYGTNLTNSLLLNNSFHLANVTNAGVPDCVVDGMTGAEANFAKWATLTVSNGLATAINLRLTNLFIRPLGINTTNVLAVPAGKVGVVSFMAYGRLLTNYCTAVQQ